jgi:hypothetical protein
MGDVERTKLVNEDQVEFPSTSWFQALKGIDALTPKRLPTNLGPCESDWGDVNLG